MRDECGPSLSHRHKTCDEHRATHRHADGGLHNEDVEQIYFALFLEFYLDVVAGITYRAVSEFVIFHNAPLKTKKPAAYG